MSISKVRATLYLNFFALAVFTSGLNIVILQLVVNYGFDAEVAGQLTTIKSVFTIIPSLGSAYILKFGYKKSMFLGLLGVTIASLIIAISKDFWTVVLLFVLGGLCHILIKLSVYSTIGFITNEREEHTNLMNAIEGVYIIGGLLGPLLFSFMIQWYYWQDAYLIIAVITGIASVFLLKTNINESEVINQESTQPKLSQTFALLYYPLVWVFLICNVLCGMLELGYKTWLPTFNTQVFQLPEAQSVLFLSIYSGGMALSRFLVGYLQKNLSWLSIQIINLAFGFVLTLIVLMAASQKHYTLVLAFMLALVGLFFGSIYPTICSSILSILPKYCHGAMTGLIVIFGQIGMTLGVSIIGFLSKTFSIHDAFYMTLVPMLILPVLLIFYNKLSYNFNLGKP